MSSSRDAFSKRVSTSQIRQHFKQARKSKLRRVHTYSRLHWVLTHERRKAALVPCGYSGAKGTNFFALRVAAQPAFEFVNSDILSFTDASKTAVRMCNIVRPEKLEVDKNGIIF